MRNAALVALGIAALVSAPSAGPDVPGRASFMGTWRAHEEGLVNRTEGNGHIDYQDLSSCLTCSMAGATSGVTEFTLISVSGNTATGFVTAASEPRNGAVGDPLTAEPVTVSTAVPPVTMLRMTVGKMRDWTFCNHTSVGMCSR